MGVRGAERCLCCFVYLQVSKTRAAAMVTMAPTSTGGEVVRVVGSNRGKRGLESGRDAWIAGILVLDEFVEELRLREAN